MTPYPAVALWQPWASFVAVRAKPLEFGRWPATSAARIHADAPLLAPVARVAAYG